MKLFSRFWRTSARPYWLPKPFCWPQSGHCQVMPLHDMPQTFSAIQAWQMQKPQRQVQQKGGASPQQWQGSVERRRRRRRRGEELACRSVDMAGFSVAVGYRMAVP